MALLARGVASVSSVDLNPAQTALCELKNRMISKVDYAEFADLLGVGNPNGHFKSITPSSPSSLSVVLPIGRAIRIFYNVEFCIPVDSKHFWNKMRQEVFERFVSEDSLRKFIASRDLSEQRINFERYFSGEAFCAAFKEFTDKKM